MLYEEDLPRECFATCGVLGGFTCSWVIANGNPFRMGRVFLSFLRTFLACGCPFSECTPHFSRTGTDRDNMNIDPAYSVSFFTRPALNKKTEKFVRFAAIGYR